MAMQTQTNVASEAVSLAEWNPDALIDELIEENRRYWKDEVQPAVASRPTAKLPHLFVLGINWYHEIVAVDVVAKMLERVHDREVKIMLAKQVWDEARHAQVIERRITEIGGNVSDFVPPPAVVRLWDFFRHVETPIEHLAGINLTCEGLALDDYENNPCGYHDTKTAEMFEKHINADERFHAAIGRAGLRRYLKTPEDFALARAACREARERYAEVVHGYLEMSAEGVTSTGASPPSTRTHDETSPAASGVCPSALPAPPESIEIKSAEMERSWESGRASQIADVLDGYYLFHALSSAASTGMLHRLREQDQVTSDILLAGLDRELGGHLLRFLEIRGIVQRAGSDAYALTPRGRHLANDVPVALLGYHAEAYGAVSTRLGALLRGESTYGVDVERNDGALGRHCAGLARAFVTPLAHTAIERNGARCVLDLGCGDASFLIDLCRENASLRGIGMEIAPAAVKEARQCVAAAGLADRIAIVEGDAFAPSSWPASCRQADVCVMVGVLHEHFRAGEAAVIRALDAYAEIFSAPDRWFLLVEPGLRYDATDANFFLIHALTKQGFPRAKDEWLQIIAKSRLQCRRALQAPNLPFGFVQYELVARR
jgi:SAM-dependent methyltransferase